MHPARLPPDDLLRDCDETRTKRSGPGGQHRNKVETAVILRHRVSGVSAEASERRSQADNRRVALFRLRLRLALVHREPPEPHPSPLWQSRRRDGRQQLRRRQSPQLDEGARRQRQVHSAEHCSAALRRLPA